MNAMFIGYLLLSSVYIFTAMWERRRSNRRIEEAYIEGSNTAQNNACAYMEQLLEGNKKLQAKYDELLSAVCTVFPNESSHKTALKYIRRAEGPIGGEDAVIERETEEVPCPNC